ncbi:DnaJ domain-containing protein [Vibrio sp. J1-1]|uniref:DNA-J related domain-containing protein n=1 Tax=Vibrio sp. J1-1 TaxID=2912251 RepID=UPI001F196C2E|nr:DNA-J related domain-containing protein [Vibrio sp. J1-1]MCF7483534.1 DnaJ domain-containing protein [Vibrio sp. J1-1]
MALPSDKLQHGEMDNPLLWPILELLRKRPSGWKVHTLASQLSEQGYIHQLDPSADKDLFKKNFLIMNALYQLQEHLCPEQWLCVEAMNITLTGKVDSSFTAMDHRDPLREYYLDWEHYEASEREVRGLLNEFWLAYKRHIGGNCATELDRAKALYLFELDGSATRTDIRKRWRKLAFRWHPDCKGGDAERFRTLCEAWNVLRAEP